MKLEGSKVLVTGGAGFVGSHLVEELLKKGCRIVILDNLSTGFKENISGLLSSEDVDFVLGDVRNYKTCLEALDGVDIVFHEAAQINPVRAVEEPLYDFEVNAKGTLNLLDSCRKKNVKKFVFASTNVYANPKYLPIDEKHPIDLLSPYAAAKLSGEAYCIVYFNTYGIKTIRLRYTNIYGPKQRSVKSESGVITIFIERILKGLPPIIFGDGKQTRDFIHVSDVVQANLLAAESNLSQGEVFNIGSGKETSVNALAILLLNLFNRKDISPISGPQREADFNRCYVDVAKAKRILNFQPKVSLESGLRETVAWWR